MNAVIGRAPDFYGPQSNNSMINAMVFDRHAAGKTAFLLGKLDAVHSYIYTLDLGPALAHLGLDSRADNQVWHLPTAAPPRSMREWIAASAAAFGVSDKSRRFGKTMMRVLGIFVPFMGELPEMNYQFERDYIFSSDKFTQTFGMQPTDYDQGLAATVAALKAAQKPT